VTKISTMMLEIEHKGCSNESKYSQIMKSISSYTWSITHKGQHKFKSYEKINGYITVSINKVNG